MLTLRPEGSKRYGNGWCFKSKTTRGVTPWMITATCMDWLPEKPWRVGVCVERHEHLTEVERFRIDTESDAVEAATWLAAMAAVSREGQPDQTASLWPQPHTDSDVQ